MKKGIKRFVFTILTILLTLVLVINLYSFISIKVFNKDIASIGGYSILEVVSGSMEPTIHVGDLIVINTNELDYKAKDIITFYDVDGSFVTHRILSINDKEMVTKGDNNDSEDAPMPVDSILGKYVFRINGGGKLLSAFKSPFTMVMILIIGVLVCVFISTDSKGNPILEEDEKEFQEFLKAKEDLKKPKKIKTNKEENNKSVKKSSAKKTSTKKQPVKKTTAKKETIKKATAKKTVTKKAGTKSTKKNK